MLVKLLPSVKEAPFVTLKFPLFELNAFNGLDNAAAPPREMFRTRSRVKSVPLGKSRVAPSSAFQVPAISVVPETWLKESASRARVPESASMVPVLSIVPAISTPR